MKKLSSFAVLCAFVLFLCLPAVLYGGVLTRNTSVDLPGVYAGSVACGDLNNDGYIDVVIIGEAEINGSLVRIARIYKNTAGQFSEITSSLKGVYFGSVVLGDYNNDGFLDIALSGIDSDDNNVLEIYKNTSSAGGQITFSRDELQTEILLSENQLRYSSLDWGDYNNDGFLDLAACGMNILGEAGTMIFKNGGGLTYLLKNDVSQVLLNINKGQIRWVDYDNDGDIDLSVCGFNTLGQRAGKIFNNNPIGILKEDKDNSEKLFKLSSSYLEWGDADNDGDPDLLQSGWYEGWYAYISLLENRMGGKLGDNLLETLTNNNPGLFIVGPVSWGDYDNDGDFDIALMGTNEFSQALGYILKNTGGDFSIDNQQAGITGLKNGFLRWFDYNGDGDLDLIAVGEDAAGNRESVIYDNDESAVATKPQAPASLKSVFVTNNDAIFSWEVGSDLDYT
ncbi:VCBS repeat-containing protein, partial [bacterium]|nr:VCBS repeat-containing protein [bacterium]